MLLLHWERFPVFNFMIIEFWWVNAKRMQAVSIRCPCVREPGRTHACWQLPSLNVIFDFGGDGCGEAHAGAAPSSYFCYVALKQQAPWPFRHSQSDEHGVRAFVLLHMVCVTEEVLCSLEMLKVLFNTENIFKSQKEHLNHRESEYLGSEMWLFIYTFKKINKD